jgi:hypothetical protein
MDLGKQPAHVATRMKKLFYILILTGITFNGYTQNRIGDLYTGFFLTNKDSVHRQQRLVFDLSKEQWTEHPAYLMLKPYSWSFAVTRMFEYPASRSFSIALGAGIRSLHHYHNGQFDHFEKNGRGRDSITLYPDGTTYKINKIALNYADVNLEFRLKLGKEHYGRLYIGMKGGYLVNCHTKYKDDHQKIKAYNIPWFTRVTFGPTVRVGYNNVCIFGHYLITPVYENNTRQEISSASVGISLMFN